MRSRISPMRRTLVLFLMLAALALAAWPAAASPPVPAAGWQCSFVEAPALHAGEHASLALDSFGAPHIAYMGQQAEGVYIFGLKYASYSAGDWQIEFVDDDAFGYASLEIDAQDEPHISYYNAHDADLIYAHYYGGKWHITHVDTAGNVGEETSLALDSAGLPHISYYCTDGQAVKYARRLPNGEWSVETVEANIGWTVPTAIAVDRLGRPHVIYRSSNADGLRYAYRSATGWRVETVPNEQYGQDVSIVVDSRNRPHIAFGTDLQYGWRDMAGSWRFSVVDDGSNYVPSLVLDGAGRPHIAYSDLSERKLLYARHDGWDWQIEEVETFASNSRAEAISLALDWAGRPQIAYYDLAPADLKFATKGMSAPSAWAYVPHLER